MACNQSHGLASPVCSFCLNETLKFIIRSLESMKKQLNNIEEEMVEKIEDEKV